MGDESQMGKAFRRLSVTDRILCAVSVGFAAIAWPVAVVKIVSMLVNIWR